MLVDFIPFRGALNDSVCSFRATTPICDGLVCLRRPSTTDDGRLLPCVYCSICHTLASTSFRFNYSLASKHQLYSCTWRSTTCPSRITKAALRGMPTATCSASAGPAARVTTTVPPPKSISPTRGLGKLFVKLQYHSYLFCNVWICKRVGFNCVFFL